MKTITFTLSKIEIVSMDLRWSYSRPSWIVPQMLLLIIFLGFLCLGRDFWLYSLAFGVANFILPLRQILWTFQTWSSNPQVLAPKTIQWSEGGLQVSSALGDTKLLWTSFVAWKETGKYFRFVVIPSRVISIPKRELTNDALEDIRQYAKKHIDYRKYRK